jgi:hypothetical protein
VCLYGITLKCVLDFTERLNALSNKIKQQIDVINTEEGTKTAFVMPFILFLCQYHRQIQVLLLKDQKHRSPGHYEWMALQMIMKNNDVQILIECKKIGEPLNINHASQLFRYFHVLFGASRSVKNL